jgi:hypothetical protein
MLKLGKKKQRAIRLNLDGTFDEIKLPRDAGKVKDGKNEVMMQPACVFTEKKTSILKSKRKIILFVEGTTKALKFKNVSTDPKQEKLRMEDFNPYWTIGEAKQFVEKETAKSLEKHKPMTWAQFVIILIPVLITAGMVAKLLMHFGAL